MGYQPVHPFKIDGPGCRQHPHLATVPPPPVRFTVRRFDCDYSDKLERANVVLRRQGPLARRFSFSPAPAIWPFRPAGLELVEDRGPARRSRLGSNGPVVRMGEVRGGLPQIRDFIRPGPSKTHPEIACVLRKKPGNGSRKPSFSSGSPKSRPATAAREIRLRQWQGGTARRLLRAPPTLFLGTPDQAESARSRRQNCRLGPPAKKTLGLQYGPSRWTSAVAPVGISSKSRTFHAKLGRVRRTRDRGSKVVVPHSLARVLNLAP